MAGAASSEHTQEVEARVLQVGEIGHTEMTTRVGRMFDHDGIGQTAFFHPLLQHQRDTAAIGQNRDQCDIVGLGHVRQVERQARAHDDRVSAVLAGDAHIVCLRIDCLHHIDGNHAAASGERFGGVNFASQRGEVRLFERGPIRRLPAKFDQVGMVMAQVDARDGAECALAGDAACQTVSRDADAHAALYDRKQRAAADNKRGKRVRGEH